MSKRNHLGAAKAHGRRAVNELRRMTADSALYWILAHKGRVAQFRRAVKGTPAARPFKQLLGVIREQATAPPRPARRKRRVVRARRRTVRSRFIPPAFLIG
jgi:hypothetical protein